MDRLRRLTPGAWIAVVGTVGGVVAFAWFVLQMPFGSFGVGDAFGAAFGIAFTAAMFFVPQVVIVFLYDIKNRGARIGGVVLGGIAAVAGVAIVVMWATGAQFEGSQSYDVKALGLWLPLIVMGIVDGVAAVVTLFTLRGDRVPTLAPTA